MKKLLIAIFIFVLVSNLSAQEEEEEEESELIYTVVESMPIFLEKCDIEGGDTDWNCNKNELIKYLRSVSQSKKYKKIKTEGRVYISYTIEKDGSLSRQKLLRGSAEDSRLDKLAMEHLNKMPNFYKAGMQNSKFVRVQINMPIDFKH